MTTTGLPVWTWPDWRRAPAGLRVQHNLSGQCATYIKPSRSPHNGAVVRWDTMRGRTDGRAGGDLSNVVAPARDLTPVRVKAWDLIGFDSSADTVSDERLQRLIGPGTVLVRVAGKRALFEAVMYNDVTARSNNVKLARLDPSRGGIREVARYVDPDTELELVAVDARAHAHR